jgi:hypothetical protein
VLHDGVLLGQGPSVIPLVPPGDGPQSVWLNNDTQGRFWEIINAYRANASPNEPPLKFEVEITFTDAQNQRWRRVAGVLEPVEPRRHVASAPDSGMSVRPAGWLASLLWGSGVSPMYTYRVAEYGQLEQRLDAPHGAGLFGK